MNATYVRLELTRVLRSRRALFFSVALPIILFEAIGPSFSKNDIGGTSGLTYYMVSMATFGLMSTTFSIGGRIAAERAIGWNRQLRLTALPSWQYVASKVVTGFAVGIPVLVLIFALGAGRGVHLDAARWVVAAVSITLAILPVAAAGVLVGYLVDKPESAQQLMGVVYSVVGFLAGIWVPLEIFPSGLRDAFEVLPFAWIPKAGRAALEGSWVGWGGAAIIVAWTVVFGALAARAYVRDTHRV